MKTVHETEIRMIWKLTIATETEKYFETEMQQKRKKTVTHKAVIETQLIFESSISLCSAYGQHMNVLLTLLLIFR